MSRSIKVGYVILIVMILGVLGFLGYTLLEMQKLTDTKAVVEEELELADARTNEKIKENKKLTEQVETLTTEKEVLEKQLSETTAKSIELEQQLLGMTAERDKWKTDFDTITKTRIDLEAQVKTLTKQIDDTKSQLDEQKKLARQLNESAIGFGTNGDKNGGGPLAYTVEKSKSQVIEIPKDIPPASDESYWANLLRDKAELEVKLQGMEDNLAQSSIQIVELRQQNEDLQLELDTLQAQSDDLAQEIKYKSNMINNLSLELARTKNDKKFISDRLTRIQQENGGLREELRQLVEAKSSLQKSIVRLTQDKNKVERELGSAENLIQSKIDEIWEIKESLDRTFKESTQKFQSPGTVELPPIMVSSGGNAPAIKFDSGATEPGFNGRIVSVNEENNFVIVDVGEEAGVGLGDALSVYRDSKYVAQLEVIQVRKDIAAADIKNQWTQVQVGDTIR
ncbi:MAG: hypothetical protein H6756_03290 [Candidatus Omnitrophica bacterium]|nr:hypothetical protein [Candidatus Omnitrophota bacterium]